MMLNKSEKFLFLIFSIVLFSLAFPTILFVFSIPHRHSIFITITLLAFVALFIRKYILKLPMYLIIILTSFYLTYIDLETYSFWGIHKTMWFELKQYLSGTITEYPIFLPHFFILLFLLVLMELQFVARKTTFVGIVLSSYLLLLNVFNEIEITKQLILLVSLVFLIKLVVHQGVPKLKYLLVPILFLIGITGLVWTIPTQKVQDTLLEKSVSYRSKLTKLGVYSTIDQRKYGVVSTSGFGEDDSELGGALLDDSRVQFKATQKKAHYWRIDSKDKYTGKGWESSSPTRHANVFFEEQVPIENGTAVSSKEESLKLSFTTTVDYVPTTYGQMTVESLSNNKRFIKNNLTNRLSLEESEQRNQFILDLKPLTYTEEQLKTVTLSSPASELDYLQLPDNYSPKVTNLAETLTKESDNLFEQVKSIETYLKQSPDLSYSKQEATYPGDNQDYVEHFLFESQVGYCDNFSTSMVVMLRSLEIPTRWVKGFNTGVVTGKSGKEDVYSVRNQDAHSWVEVYFKGYGWIPFEPTPTFSQPAMTQEDQAESTKSSHEATPTKSSTELKETKETTESSEQEVANKKKKEVNQRIDWQKILPILLVILFVILLILFFLLYRYRLYLYAVFALQDNRKGFMEVYPKLLKELETKVLRDEEMPLMEYALLLEMQYSDYRPYFSYLTKLYENELYGNIQEFSKKDKETVLKLILLIIRSH